MGWNYRVTAEKSGGELVYSIRDVYYGEDGEAESFSADPVSLLGEDKNVILEDLKLILLAFNKPTLYVSGDTISKTLD